MTVRELREKYLAFFESKGHRRHPSGSLIPYDVTGRLDESLLFNGAGMIQFKPYFRGVAKPDHPRLTTVQKCVRTGDIDEVGDATHLTFFEMLGNFSFGDYFKTEAIRFSWEFLTSPEWLGLDPVRLSFTVFDEDGEAESAWRECGATRVYRLGEDTNYWPAGAFSKGPPGPCGPNSEMFYWTAPEAPPSGEYSADQWVADEAAGKWVEIWNDVFIQFEWQGVPADRGYVKTGMSELPFRSIDTGMGLERTAMVLSGESDVYATDAFTGILAAIEKITSTSPETIRATKIVADHVRTATFCIADGVLPSNNGRGYVLRRLVRRAVLKGSRDLNAPDGFFATIAETVIDEYGSVYPELREQRTVVLETLRNEESLFRRTLKAGTERLGELLGSTISGEDAFRLYDTFGFPLEVTKELATEAGVSVDEEGYDVALKRAQALSRGADERESVYGGVGGATVTGDPAPTEFLGYDVLEADATITGVKTQGDRVWIALDRTPFYAESGGQAGDSGALLPVRGEGAPPSRPEEGWTVIGTAKTGGVFWHELASEPGEGGQGALPTAPGSVVRATVDADRRRRTEPHHTGTHLLHLALREELGDHATQAGSAVGPDRLRFDFTHGAALTAEQRERIERRVNALARENHPVTIHVDITPQEAKERGAMALFGEKYGDKVRMVEVGPSKELCGGTHVRSSAEVYPFRILAEASAQSGVRRIEAVAGEAALETYREETARLGETATVLKARPTETVEAVQRLQTELKEERSKREKAERAALSGGGKATEETAIGAVKLLVLDLGETDPKTAQALVDEKAANRADLVVLAATAAGGKVLFVAKAGKDAVAAGAHAGDLLKTVARIAGGGGGGRAEFATAGGRDASKIAEALAAAEPSLRTALGV